MNARVANEPRTPDTPPALRITAQDMERLRAVVERALETRSRAAAAELLELELDRAVVVPQERMAPDVVTMRSRILFEDVETGRRREATLVYPEEADMAQSKVSVLAPVGLAVLGLKVGDVIEWPLPNERRARLRIVELLYQPELAGDFHL
ncbi:MAG TPA: nucleoside diphosphate kinase regulator [Myxococcus sp.]|nr:nucleoside diphosphate kinase regulator [Myxococcus sp.]